jgi:hypothetical protein
MTPMARRMPPPEPPLCQLSTVDVASTSTDHARPKAIKTLIARHSPAFAWVSVSTSKAYDRAITLTAVESRPVAMPSANNWS